MRVEANKNPGYRVFVDGEDVSSDAFVADDESGMVGLFLRDNTGSVRVADGEFVRLERRGVVRIEPAT